jgi:hypothetical protein
MLIFLLCALLTNIVLFILPMNPPFLLLGRTPFVLTLFMFLMFLLFLIWSCSLCLLGRSLTRTVVLFLILIFAIFRIVALVTWLALAPVIVIHSVFGSLTGFIFLPLRPSVLSTLSSLLCPRRHLLSDIIVWITLVAPSCQHCFIAVF